MIMTISTTGSDIETWKTTLQKSLPAFDNFFSIFGVGSQTANVLNLPKGRLLRCVHMCLEPLY